MTPLEKYLAEVKEREEKATPLPWGLDYCSDEYGGRFWRAEGPVVETKEQAMKDSKFIAAARTDVPKLMAIIEELLDAVSYMPRVLDTEMLERLDRLAEGKE